MRERGYSPELFGPPTVDDFEMLEEDMWELAQQPGTLTAANGCITRYNMLSRLLIVEDCRGQTREIMVGVAGTLRVVDAVRKLDIVYVERLAVDTDQKDTKDDREKEPPELKKEFMLERRGNSVSPGARY